jgi:transmembrane sensor
MDEQYKKQLIERYVAGAATENELLAFFGLVNKGELDHLIAEHMDREIEELRYQPARKSNRKKWLIVAVALISLSIPAYLLLNKPENNSQLAQNQPEQISPVNHNVTLTLAGGKKVKLNKGYSGQIAANITQKDSLLNYQNTPATEVADNTLTNNSADKFTVMLADGTQATLDVASSLTYPSVFGKERKVAMTGQVYFKVKHDAKKGVHIDCGNRSHRRYRNRVQCQCL